MSKGFYSSTDVVKSIDSWIPSAKMATAPDLPILTDVDHNEVTLSSLLAGRRVLVLILRHAF